MMHIYQETKRTLSKWIFNLCIFFIISLTNGTNLLAQVPNIWEGYEYAAALIVDYEYYASEGEDVSVYIENTGNSNQYWSYKAGRGYVQDGCAKVIIGFNKGTNEGEYEYTYPDNSNFTIDLSDQISYLEGEGYGGSSFFVNYVYRIYPLLNLSATSSSIMCSGDSFTAEITLPSTYPSSTPSYEEKIYFDLQVAKVSGGSWYTIGTYNLKDNKSLTVAYDDIPATMLGTELKFRVKQEIYNEDIFTNHSEDDANYYDYDYMGDDHFYLYCNEVKNGSYDKYNFSAYTDYDYTSDIISGVFFLETPDFKVNPIEPACYGEEASIEITDLPVTDSSISLLISLCKLSSQASDTASTNTSYDIEDNIYYWYDQTTFNYTIPAGVTTDTIFADDITDDNFTLDDGGYLLTVQYNDGTTNSLCSKDTAFLISTPDSLHISATATNTYSEGYNISSSSGTDSITVTLEGATTPYSLSYETDETNYISTSDTEYIISGFSSGTYTIYANDANSCAEKTATVTLTKPDELIITSSDSSLDCYGDTDGSLSFVISGGIKPFSVVLTADGIDDKIKDNLSRVDETNNKFSDLSKGSYTLTVTDNQGNTADTTVSVTEPPELSISSATPTTTTCNEGDDGTITISASGGTSSYTYGESSTGLESVSSTLSGFSSGNYTVWVEDTKGCTASLSGISVSEPSTSLTIISSNPSSATCEETDGSVTLTVSGGWSNMYDCTVNLTKAGLTKGTKTIIAGSTSMGVTFNNLDDGTYSANVSYSNETTTCTGYLSEDIEITSTNPMTVTPYISKKESCDEVANGEIIFTVENYEGTLTATSDYTFTKSLNIYTIADCEAEESYAIEIKDGRGCVKSGLKEMELTDTPTSFDTDYSSSSNASCSTASNGEIEFKLSGGIEGYTFKVEDVSVTPSYTESTGMYAISNKTPGTYTLQVTDAETCKITEEITIGANDNPITISNISTTSESCGGISDGVLEITASSSETRNGTLSYSIDEGANTQFSNVFSDLTASTYYIRVEDEVGCYQTSEKIVGSLGHSPNPTITYPVSLACSTATNGTVSVGLSGYNDDPDITYGITLLNASSDLVSSSVSTTTFSYNSLSNQTYTLIVSDDDGCTYTNTINVPTISNPVSLTIDEVGKASCTTATNGSIDVSASGSITDSGYTYTISGASDGYTEGGTSTAYKFSSLMYDDVVTVTVTDDYGCTDDSEVTTIGVGPNVFAISNVIPTSASCPGTDDGELDVNYEYANYTSYSLSLLKANDENTYEAYTNDQTSIDSSANITGLLSGLYKVILTDDDNCAADYSFLIEEPSDPTITVTNDARVINYGDCTGEITYTISGGNGTFNRELYKSGILIGGTVEVNSGTYTISDLSAGEYELKIQDINECNYSTSTNSWYTYNIAIEQPSTELQLTVATSNVTCNDEGDGTITLIASGGWGSYKYYFSTSNNQSYNQDSNGFRGDLLPNTYYVKVVDLYSAEVETFVIINEPETLVLADIEASDIMDATCPGYTNSSITLSASGGTLFSDNTLNYWAIKGSDINTKISNQSGSHSYNFTGLGTGSYYIYVKDGNDCEDQSNLITITDYETPIISSWNNYIEEYGENTGKATVSIEGGSGNFTYEWEQVGSDLGIESSSTTENLLEFDDLTSGNYQFTISDAANCAYWDESTELVIPITIVQPDASLALSITETNHVSCKSLDDGSFTVDASGGWGGVNNAEYLYSLDSVTWQDNGLFSPLEPGDYQVYIIDTAMISRKAAITITEPDTLELYAISDLDITNASCPGYYNGIVELTASNRTDAEYNVLNYWTKNSDAEISDTQTGGSTHAFTGLLAGEYNMFVSDKNNCTDSKTFTVTQPVVPEITYWNNYVADKGQATGAAKIFIAGGNDKFSYQWDLLDAATTLSAAITAQDTILFNDLYAGNYQITLSDTAECYYWGESNTKVIDIAIVEPDTILTLEVIDTTHVSCKSFTDGAFQIKAIGGWAGIDNNEYQYSIDNINWQNSGLFDTLTVGTYYLYLQDTAGVSRNTTLELTEPDTLNLFVNKIVDASCPNYADGEAHLTALNGIAYDDGLHYWAINQDNMDSIGIQAGDNSYVFNSIPKGDYHIYVGDKNNCVASKAFTISQPDTAIIQLDYNYIFAKGDSVGYINAEITEGNNDFYFEWYNQSLNQLIDTGRTSLLTGISNLLAGDYLLRVKDTAECVYEEHSWMEREINIAEPEKSLSFVVDSNVAVTCNGLSNGWFQLIGVGGWGNDYRYGLTNDPSLMVADSLFVGLSANTYDVYIQDTVGIVYTNPVTITQPDILTATIDSTKDVNCYGENNGYIWLSAQGGNLSYLSSTDSLNWYDGTSLIHLYANKYGVYLKDTLDCTVKLDSVQIDQPTDIVLLDKSIRISKCLENSGRIDVSIDGGVPEYTYWWQNDSINSSDYTSNVADSLYAGVYILTVIDQHYCEKSYDFYVSDLTDLNIDTIFVEDVSCWGYSDGSASIDAYLGTKPYIYSWDVDLPQISSSHMSDIATGLYTAGVSDSEGCIVYKEFYIGTPDSLGYEITSLTQPLCYGGYKGIIDLLPTGGTPEYALSWSTGSSATSINELDPGHYGLTITDEHSCINHFDFTLDYQRTIYPDLGADTMICQYQSLTIDPGLFTTYNWTSSNDFSYAEQIATLNDEANYFLTVTDDDYCIGYDTLALEVSYLAINQIDLTDVTCNKFADGQAVLSYTLGYGNTVISWPDGSGNEQWNNLSGGSYSVTINDDHGCEVIEDFSIYEPDTLSIAITEIQDPLCFGNFNGVIDIEASGGRGEYTYLWNTGDLTYRIAQLDTGSYDLVMKDLMNCTFEQDFRLDYRRFLDPQLGNDTMICQYQSLTIDPGSFTTYDWRATNEFNYAEQIATLNDEGDYYLTVTDDDDCIGYDTLALAISYLDIDNIEITDVSCNKFADGNAVLTYTAGYGNSVITWSDNSSGSIFSNLSGGNYSVSVNDDYGCEVTQTFSVYEPDTLGFTTNEIIDPLCLGNFNGSIDITAFGGRGEYTYLWNTGSDENTIAELDTGNYSLTIKDWMACTFVQDFRLDYRRFIAPDLGQDTMICHYETLNVDPGSFTTYKWTSDNNFKSTNQMPDIDDPSVYYLTVTDDDDCLGYDTLSVDVSYLDIIDITITDVTCNGDADGQAVLSYTSGYGTNTITWPAGVGTSTWRNISGGDYKVNINDEHGCTDSLDFSIYEPDQLSLETQLLVDPYCFGVPDGQIKVQGYGGRGNYTYDWSNGEDDRNINKLDTGYYHLSYWDEMSCLDTASYNLNYQTTIYPQLGDDVIVCDGNDYFLYPGDFMEYSWSASSYDLLSTDTSLVTGIASTYYVEVMDEDYCVGRDTMEMIWRDADIDPSFLVSSTVGVGDTVYMVEVSQPIPDSFEWNIGGSYEVVEQGTYHIKIIFTETGVFDVGIDAYLDGCLAQERKKIVVVEESVVSDDEEEDTSTESMQVLTFTASPNPATDYFEANVELAEVLPVTFYVVNISTGVIIERRDVSGLDTYTQSFTVPSIKSVLLLFIVVEDERHSLKIIAGE